MIAQQIRARTVARASIGLMDSSATASPDLLETFVKLVNISHSYCKLLISLQIIKHVNSHFVSLGLHHIGWNASCWTIIQRGHTSLPKTIVYIKTNIDQTANIVFNARRFILSFAQG